MPTDILEFFAQFGTGIGLLIYILLKEVIPFAKDKLWPQFQKDRDDVKVFRRESDQRLLDLEERKVIADEQIAMNLILLTQKTDVLAGEIRRHDEKTYSLIFEITATLASIQALTKVLFDRMERAVNPQTFMQDQKGE